MIRILRHTLCLVLLLTLAACSKEEPGYNPPAVATQTLPVSYTHLTLPTNSLV